MRRYHRTREAGKGNHCGRSAARGFRFLRSRPCDARFRFGSSSGKILELVPVVLALVAVRIFIIHFRTEETDVSGGASENRFCDRRTGSDSKEFLAVKFQSSRAIGSDREILIFSFPESRVRNFRAASRWHG